MIGTTTPRPWTSSRPRIVALGGAVLGGFTALAQVAPAAAATRSGARPTGPASCGSGAGPAPISCTVRPPKPSREPLLLVFHGGGGTAAGMARLTHLNDDRRPTPLRGRVPPGVENSWAGGLGGTPADEAGVDDVGFVRALIDHLARSGRHRCEPGLRHRVVQRRVHGPTIGVRPLRTGSPGIAPVAATLPVTDRGPVRTPAPHAGPRDPGHARPARPLRRRPCPRPGLGGRQALSAPDTAAHWAQDERLPVAPAHGHPPVTAPDGTQIRTDTYGPCPTGPVVLYTIEGGGHTWPGGEQYLPVAPSGAPPASSTPARRCGSSSPGYRAEPDRIRQPDRGETVPARPASSIPAIRTAKTTTSPITTLSVGWPQIANRTNTTPATATRNAAR